MSAGDVEAARDPDAPPLIEADVARMRRVPQVKTLRRALGLTQEEFAARYAIPIGTLRDWEQGRTKPDQPARAYLRAIARNPEGVFRDLQDAPTSPSHSPDQGGMSKMSNLPDVTLRTPDV